MVLIGAFGAERERGRGTRCAMRIGIDLGGTKIEGIALDDAGSERGRLRVPTPQHDYPGTAGGARRPGASGSSSTAGARGTVGIGIPGVVSPATGLVKNANSVWLIGHPLDRDLERAAGPAGARGQRRQLLRPVRGGRRRRRRRPARPRPRARTSCSGSSSAPARAAAWWSTARCWWGPTPSPASGATTPCPGRAPTSTPGPPCYCGRTGCIETFLSGPGLARDHQRATAARRSTAPAIVAAGRRRRCRGRGHAFALRGPDGARAGLDPQRARSRRGGAGGRAVQDRAPLPQRPRSCGGNTPSPTPCARRLRPPRHGDSSGVRGAAWLWSRRVARARRHDRGPQAVQDLPGAQAAARASGRRCARCSGATTSRCRRWTTSASTSPPASGWAFWAPTARARPPRSRSSRACSTRPAARPGWPGFVPRERSPDFLRTITLVMGQKQQLLWDLPPVETYAMNRALYDIPKAEADAHPGRAGRAAGDRPADRQADPPAVAGRADEVRAGGGAAPPAEGAVPRRAHHRPRRVDAGAHAPVHPRLQRAPRRHGDPDQPLHGGRGRALPAHHRHRQGPPGLRRRPARAGPADPPGEAHHRAPGRAGRRRGAGPACGKLVRQHRTPRRCWRCRPSGSTRPCATCWPPCRRRDLSVEDPPARGGHARGVPAGAQRGAAAAPAGDGAAQVQP